MTKRRIGVLTGGGDVPGLNSVIKTLAWRLEEAGHTLVGVRSGWAGLLNLEPGSEASRSRWIVPLDRAATRRIDRTGGTVLHTSRLNPALLLPHQVPTHLRSTSEPGEATSDRTGAVIEALEGLRLDALVAIGGDGTLSFAKRLHQEGFPVVAVPKTMDNDVFGTEYSLGFSTAVTRSVQAIQDLRTVAGSHERFLIVELFGRHSGEPCLLASYLAWADRALLSEVPFDFDRVGELLAADRRANPSNYAVLTISEGAHPVGERPLESGEPDAVGNRKLGGIGGVLAEELRRRTGQRAIYQPLGYLLRSGVPDSLDRLVAHNFAHLAASRLLAGESGFMVALTGGRYTSVSIERIGEGERRVDVERFYDREAYMPKIEEVRNLPMFLH